MNKYIVFLFVFLVACTSKQYKSDTYTLIPTENYYICNLDNDTRVPLNNLYLLEQDSLEYLTFSNPGTRSILIYNIPSGRLEKKLTFPIEGANGIGGSLYGYLIRDFNHIYIPSINRSVIYETDTTGVIRDVYDFTKTSDGILTVPAYYTNHDNKQLYFIGDTLYIPQMLNRSIGEKSWIENSPTFIAMDTLNKEIVASGMLYPHEKINSDNYGLYIADLTYSSVCVDNNIVYSFALEDNLYKQNLHTGKVARYMAKSRVISEIELVKLSLNSEETAKKNCEMASYGNILYDKFRKVYYRFVFPKTSLGKEDNYIEILQSGRKEFSIMILDQDFNLLGEVLFPPFTYLPQICFINKDGLYISVNHFKRKDYSDDILRFQLINLQELK